MQTMRESWTDERLDDLKQEVHEGFRRADGRFDRIDERFECFEVRLDERFDALQRTLIGTSGVVIAALLGIIATQL